MVSFADKHIADYLGKTLEELAADDSYTALGDVRAGQIIKLFEASLGNDSIPKAWLGVWKSAVENLSPAEKTSLLNYLLRNSVAYDRKRNQEQLTLWHLKPEHEMMRSSINEKRLMYTEKRDHYRNAAIYFRLNFIKEEFKVQNIGEAISYAKSFKN